MTQAISVPARTWRAYRAASFVLAFGLTVGGVLLLRVPQLGMDVENDMAVFSTIATLVDSGSLPYRDVFDHKQPFVYAAYLLLHTLWPYDVEALRVISALLAGLTAFVLYAGLESILGPPRAALAAAIAMVAGTSTYVQGADLNTEHLVLPFVAGAVLLPLAARRRAWRWLPVAAGVLAAVPLFTKAPQVAAAAAGLIPLLAFRSVRGQSVRRTLVLWAAPAAAALVVLLGVYAASGALRPLFESVVVYNGEYRASNPFWGQFERVWTFFREVLLLALVVCVACIVLLWRAEDRRDVVRLTLVAWFAGAFLATWTTNFSFPYYYAGVVPAAAAVLAALPLRRGSPRTLVPSVLVAALAVAVLVPFALDVAETVEEGPRNTFGKMQGVRAGEAAVMDDMGDVIRSRGPNPGDRMYVTDTEAGFYWYARVKPATRFITELSFDVRKDFLAEARAGICRFPPRFLVLSYGTYSPAARCLEKLRYNETFRIFSAVLLERDPSVDIDQTIRR